MAGGKHGNNDDDKITKRRDVKELTNNSIQSPEDFPSQPFTQIFKGPGQATQLSPAKDPATPVLFPNYTVRDTDQLKTIQESQSPTPQQESSGTIPGWQGPEEDSEPIVYPPA